MQELWTSYGFYLWVFTTALVVVALVWLAWNTFGPTPATHAGSSEEADVVEVPGLDELEAQVVKLTEAVPYMQATLGRVMQYYGLEKFSDPMGAQAFALAVASSRGDGFILSSSVRGGLVVKTLAGWQSPQALTAEEEAATEQARAQKTARA